MASIRPSKCYHWDTPAYTRVSNNPADSFITGVPGIKISRFDSGNKKAQFEVEIDLVSDETIQIRHNALEACRQAINRYLEKKLGRQNYHMKILVYPHHIMRENKMATGAGADRVQSGMRQSFGKPIGKAARVQAGQRIIWVKCQRDKLSDVREALRRGKIKLPCKTSIDVQDLT